MLKGISVSLLIFIADILKLDLVGLFLGKRNAVFFIIPKVKFNK